MKAYCTDLRSKILAAVDAGKSKAEVARLFGVSRASVKRYAVLRRDHGSIDPRPRPGTSPTVSRDDHPALWAQLETHPDATLADHCQLWDATQGVQVSVATMSRAIRRLGWTRKKDGGCRQAERRAAPHLAPDRPQARCPAPPLRR